METPTNFPSHLLTRRFRVTITDMDPSTDQQGRRAYRMTARADAAQATADAVLDAAVGLFTDKPYDEVSLDQVAARADVTQRTVIRRFGGKEGLFTAAMNRAVDAMLREREAAPVDDVPGAVHNVVDHYERWGANRLRMISQEDRIAIVREHVQHGRRMHRIWVERTFPRLLAGVTGAARERRVNVLVVATDLYTWKLLRRDLGLGRVQAERTIVDLIDGIQGDS